ncbi:MAG: hypothetical protein GWN87_18600, partial [Desulfuromonadales bacterium]|nr:hypothetical protein [Desulfuromonadales bacterium]NIS41363.1 hypothetical protein [Desulfuromonadales bacterium]
MMTSRLYYMVSVACMILLTACQGRVVEAPAAAPPVVWPPAPNEPRIAYVKSFSGPSDLGIESSLIGRL